MKRIQIEKFEQEKSLIKLFFYFLAMVAFAIWGPGEF